MKSVMKHQFSMVPRASIPRAAFNRSNGLHTTFDVDTLIPIYVDEALPGDTVSVRMSGFGRLSTPIVPIMDNLYLQTFFFAVPERLVWNNFQKFNGEQDNPNDSTDYLLPKIYSPEGGFDDDDVHSIYDYFGIPIRELDEPDQKFAFRAGPFRAYNLIWNEWFRSQTLQNSVPVPKDDGPDRLSDYQLLKINKKHDYFTSALPWPQKGPSIDIPLGQYAPVSTNPASGVEVIGVTSNAQGKLGNINTSAGPNADLGNLTGTGTFMAGEEVMLTGLQADLSQASAATVNQLRQAFQIQKLLERDARGGTRYTEIIRSHFGVISPDARLQRPEYLGGGKTYINIHPVQQTSATVDDGTPQGNLAAFGTVGLNGHGFTKSFTEHTIIIGLAAVRADLTYSQGLDKFWSRETRWDFYWPAFAHLGEQPIKNKEIFMTGTEEIDEDVFGYQEYAADYRYKRSRLTGLMRPEVANNLSMWNLSEKFNDTPLLNDQFIPSKTPIERCLAVEDEPHIIFNAYFNEKWVRPMPVYSVPGLIDHF